ncbi:TonB-dependent receptor domain-containing protein [Sphingomonas flavalba]|uniref:TonB-dependent receptor domain-containing protein n=1 Tax=Sphingomonas flavalba TaxID=2559804 RepID=UPI00144759B6|nr:TonB-dependent receptor [Sphingomonas flavalba]
MKNVRIHSAFILSTTALGCLMAPAAFAQGTAPSGAAAASEGGDIIVTGSRIRQANLESISPVTQVDIGAIQARGVERVEDVVNRLPQVQAAKGGNFTNRGRVGTAQIDLRGLGADRTLVLINGRRLPYGSVKDVPADVNLVPNPLIKNIEVLTGGASAVYGSDALAGVVNFNLIDDFEGLRVNATISGFQHNNRNKMMRSILDRFETANPGEFPTPTGSTMDGLSQTYSLVAGANFDDGRGNVTLYGSYRKINGVYAQRRDYASCRIGAASGGQEYTCNPSPVDTPASFVNTGAPNLLSQFRVLNNEFVPRNSLVDTYNDVNGGRLQRPDERYMFGGLAHFEVNEHFTPYIEFGFTRDHSGGLEAPGAAQRNAISLTDGGFNCDNPFFSAQEADFLCTSRGLSTASNYDPVTGAYLGPASIATGVFLNKRTPENNFRDEQVTLTSFRMVGGLRGKLFGPFEYDFSASYANVHQSRVLLGMPSQQRISTALFAVVDRRVDALGAPLAATFGQPVCAINADSLSQNDDPACQPLDYFSDAGPSAAAAKYVNAIMTATGDAGQLDLVFAVNGDLGEYGIKSPLANNAMAIAFGGEYRKNTLNSNPDKEYIDGKEDFPISGKAIVKEFFGEVTLPLVEDAPLFKLLSVEGAYRYSKYKGGISTDTYKLGVNWSPVRDLRFRASYQRAVRAPNLIELYAPQIRPQNSIQLPINANGTYDPCSGPTPFATFEQCARTGVTAAQYGNIADYNFFGALNGGNPDLQPETGKTKSLGAVFEPSFIPGFTASLDYFDIKVTNLIGRVAPVLALAQCLNTGDPYFCSLIHRGQGGTLHATDDSYFKTVNVNTGSLRTAGVDVALNYRLETERVFGNDLGRLSFSLNGTYVDKFTTKPLPSSSAAETYNCAGYYAFLCGSPHPKWRHVFATTWDTPWDLGFTLTWRYIDTVKIARSSGQAALQGSFAQVDYKLPAQSYFDLSAAWYATEKMTLRAGINNLLDRSPPLTSQATSEFGGNLNTFPAYYDALGRFLFVSAQIDF